MVSLNKINYLVGINGKKQKEKKTATEKLEDSKNKGIDMLRLDRKMTPILDRWREAKQQNPQDWK
jgi:hypothetical protein